MRPGKNWPYLPDFVASACKVLAIDAEAIAMFGIGHLVDFIDQAGGQADGDLGNTLDVRGLSIFLDFLGIRIVTIG